MKYALSTTLLVFHLLSLSAQNALIDLYNPLYQNLLPLQTDSLYIRTLDTYHGTLTRAIGYKYEDDGTTLLGWYETREEQQPSHIWTIALNVSNQSSTVVLETVMTDSLTHRKIKDRQMFTGGGLSQPDSIVTELWDSIEWVPTQKTLFTYTPIGQVASRLDLRWEANASEWINDNAIGWGYDNQNRLILRRSKFWKEVEWRTVSDYVYTYTGNNSQPRSIVWLAHAGADSTTMLNPVDSMAVWYDNEGQVDSSLTFIWNPYSNAWSGTSRSVMGDDEEKKATQGKDYVKSPEGTWTEKTDPVFTPGDQVFTDEPAEVLTKIYDPKTEEWKDIKRRVVSYTPIGANRVYGSIQILEMNDSLQDWQETFFAEAWLRILPSNLQEDSVEDRSRKFTIVYSCDLPNPYVRNRTFVFPANDATGDYALEIFSAEGRMVYRKRYDDSGVGYVDAPLQPGVYMASVSRGGTPLCTQKLIVQ